MKPLPMLATKAAPFDSEDYLFEVKWDGVRALAAVEQDSWKQRRRVLTVRLARGGGHASNPGKERVLNFQITTPPRFAQIPWAARRIRPEPQILWFGHKQHDH
jgi:hypothetical protein